MGMAPVWKLQLAAKRSFNDRKVFLKKFRITLAVAGI